MLHHKFIQSSIYHLLRAMVWPFSQWWCPLYSLCHHKLTLLEKYLVSIHGVLTNQTSLLKVTNLQLIPFLWWCHTKLYLLIPLQVSALPKAELNNGMFAVLTIICMLQLFSDSQPASSYRRRWGHGTSWPGRHVIAYRSLILDRKKIWRYCLGNYSIFPPVIDRRARHCVVRLVAHSSLLWKRNNLVKTDGPAHFEMLTS